MTYSFTGNLGDEIQSIAARAFLPRVDDLIDREHLHDFRSSDGALVKTVLNGWFMHRPENWPPSSDVWPLLVSFHLTGSEGLQGIRLRAAEILLSDPAIKYLRHFGPVGARDLHTLDLLQRADVESYFSGCLTMTLKRPSVEPEDVVVLNDVPEPIANHVRSRTSKRVMTTRHSYTSKEFPDQSVASRFSAAEKLLTAYAAASCVITTRLHCALPCLAMGTPVLLLNTAKDTERFSGLLEHVRNCSVELYLSGKFEFDVNQPAANPETFLPIRRDLVRRVEEFVAADAVRPFRWSVEDELGALRFVHEKTKRLLALERSKQK